MTNANLQNHWDEETSKRYLDYGRYFVPARELQMLMISDLLKGINQFGLILELCCREGLLAEMFLDNLPGSTYLGLDGSSLMLEKARQRLARFGKQASLRLFDLADRSWRQPKLLIQAVVSMLAIHHLDADGKQTLFSDVNAMVAPGGVFIIADMVDPATPSSREIAADAWDEVVRQRSMELEGNTAALDFFLREGWNTYRYLDPDDIDHPSPIYDQLRWLEQAGFMNIDVHFLQAGHALFSGRKTSGSK